MSNDREGRVSEVTCDGCARLRAHRSLGKMGECGVSLRAYVRDHKRRTGHQALPLYVLAPPLGLALRAKVLGHTGSKACDNCSFRGRLINHGDTAIRCHRDIPRDTWHDTWGPTDGRDLAAVPRGTRPDDCPGWRARA